MKEDIAEYGRLLVFGISEETSKPDLQNYFSKYGRVEDIEITAHEELTGQNGEPILIGVVTMSLRDI